jgi:UDP-sulfoquinovose synthase
MFIFLSANFSIFAHAPQDKKVMVLGGDGFCGWATSLYLSEQGYDVSIVDNLSRRKISQELHAESLTPICSIDTRLATWKEITGKTIHFYLLDIASDYQDFKALIETEKPDVIIHFAEQRSAPYSMKNSQTNRYTVSNNLNATNNVLNAIVETGLDIHLVHLGTMGVYGYGAQGDLIPEGYLKITTPSGNQREILHPADPGTAAPRRGC